MWWFYTPHDGQRNVNSAAQEEMAKGGSGGSKNMTDEERIAAANMIWNKEKGTAAAIIIISWLSKVRIKTQYARDWTHIFIDILCTSNLLLCDPSAKRIISFTCSFTIDSHRQCRSDLL